MILEKKIETKKDVKLFRTEIKKKLKDFLSNVEGNLDDNLAFEIWNSEDSYICHIFVSSGTTIPELRRIAYYSIKVENFMHGNGFNLNKDTTDYQLNKVAKRIINEYNEIVDKLNNMVSNVVNYLNISSLG